MPIKLLDNFFFLMCCMLLYGCTAYFSSGVHNADEHYQILEFANYKFGNAQVENLAWEFPAKVRSGLQPLLCYIILLGLKLFGVVNPYDQAFVLRLITGIAYIFVIRFFVKSIINDIEKPYRLVFILTSYLLWFLPYINVRFSSESWSGLMVILGIGILWKHNITKPNGKLLSAGLLLGLAVLFRYQSAMLMFGVFCWLIIIKKTSFKSIALFVVGGLLILISSLFIDHWLYGQWTFAPYNYFYKNIVENVASRYGVSPWYEILLYILTGPSILLGVVITLTYLTMIYYHPKHILVWAIIPFLLIHTLIAHKELRFLFPLTNFVPFIVFYGLQSFESNHFRLPHWSKLGLFVCLGLTNLAGIIAVSTTGAGRSTTSVAQFINKRYGGSEVTVLYVKYANPYSDWAFPKETFYGAFPNVKKIEIGSIWQSDFQKLLNQRKATLLILNPEQMTGPRTDELLKKLNLELVYENISPIARYVNRFYNEDINNNLLRVYELRRTRNVL